MTREEPAKIENVKPSATYRGNGESILVVDDVKEQRELATNMLARLGYRVSTAAGGEDAVEYIKNNKVDLILLDMIMDPGIDGMETLPENKGDQSRTEGNNCQRILGKPTVSEKHRKWAPEFLSANRMLWRKSAWR